MYLVGNSEISPMLTKNAGNKFTYEFLIVFEVIHLRKYGMFI